MAEPNWTVIGRRHDDRDKRVGGTLVRVKWWVYPDAIVEEFQRWLATTVPPATIGRVWPTRDGLFYWCCTECTETILRRRPGWQDVELGGCAESIADGHNYIKAHYKGGSCVARFRA